MHKGEPHTFTPEQVCAMFFGKLKADTEKEIGGKFHDVVISCPGWWNDSQRHALIGAAQVAGLNVLRLIHETTAVALQYSIFKQDLPEKEPQHVMFVDIGHSQLSVCIAALTKKDLRVLASSYDPNLGGRNFDDILVEHFSSEFQQKFKIDVRSNPRALLRVRTACEKLKKVLSANPEAPISIESLMNDVDVRGFMKRDHFEQLAKPLLERIAATLTRCLTDAKLTAAQLNAVEIVGGASRIPMVQRIMQETLGREPGKTQNASESVVRGCVLAAAAMSVGARVKEVKVQDAFPYAVRLRHEQDAPTELVKRFNEFPHQFQLSYTEHQPFTLAADYAGDLSALPAGTAPHIATWRVELPASEAKRDVKVRLALNASGLLHVENAHYVETTEVIEPAPAPTATPASPEKMDTSDTSAPAPDAKPAAAAAPEPKKKTVTKIHNLTVKVEHSNALAPQKLKQYAEEEAKMAAEDRLFIETAERRNALESYILTFRSRLGAQYAQYATAEQTAELNKQLDETEAWLNDAPDDTPKSVLVERHVKLQRLGDPVAHRHRDFTDAVPDALNTLRSAIAAATALVSSADAKHDHIPEAEREPVRKEIATQSAWLAQQEAALASAPRTQSPPVHADEVKKRATALTKQASDVMGKAKPQPPPPPPKKEEEKKADAAAAAAGAQNGGAAPADAASGADKKAADASKAGAAGNAAKSDEKEKPAHTQMDIDA